MDCQTHLSRVERAGLLADFESAIEHLYGRIVDLLPCLGAHGSIAGSDGSSGGIPSGICSGSFPVGPNVGFSPVESGYSAPSGRDSGYPSL